MTGTSKTRAVGDCACWLPNLFTKFTTSMQIIYKIGRLPLFSGWRRLLLLSWAGLLMPLQKQLIALTPKKLIACRECQVNADVSMNGSNVKLICPSSTTRWGVGRQRPRLSPTSPPLSFQNTRRPIDLTRQFISGPAGAYRLMRWSRGEPQGCPGKIVE